MVDPPEIAVRIGDRLRDRNETLATAESVTGGLLSSLITDVPGSSDYFDRGFVTYAYDAKTGLLGVDREVLDEHGAVSAAAATAMARAARDLASTTWGVSVTGIAGPTGGTAAKPVGTTYIGVAYAGSWGSGTLETSVAGYRFDGERSAVKRAAAEQAVRDLGDRIADRQ